MSKQTEADRDHEERLSVGEFLQLAGRQGDRLHCRSGRLLITQEGIVEDFELCAGASLILPGRGMVLVEAVETAKLNIQVRPAPFRFRKH